MSQFCATLAPEELPLEAIWIGVRACKPLRLCVQTSRVSARIDRQYVGLQLTIRLWATCDAFERHPLTHLLDAGLWRGVQQGTTLGFQGRHLRTETLVMRIHPQQTSPQPPWDGRAVHSRSASRRFFMRWFLICFFVYCFCRSQGRALFNLCFLNNADGICHTREANVWITMHHS